MHFFLSASPCRPFLPPPPADMVLEDTPRLLINRERVGERPKKKKGFEFFMGSAGKFLRVPHPPALDLTMRP